MPRPAELYLVITPGAKAADCLAVALEAATIASVLIRGANGQGVTLGEAAPLVELAQRHGAAALVAGSLELARRLGADGIHVPTSGDVVEQMVQLREKAGTKFAIGAEAGPSRHVAMELGEAGVDYVAFGLAQGDIDQAQDARADLVGWWAEIFEVPCVAFDVTSGLEAEELALLGADFIAVTLDIESTAAATRDQILAIAGAIAEAAATGDEAHAQA